MTPSEAMSWVNVIDAILASPHALQMLVLLLVVVLGYVSVSQYRSNLACKTQSERHAKLISFLWGVLVSDERYGPHMPDMSEVMAGRISVDEWRRRLAWSKAG